MWFPHPSLHICGFNQLWFLQDLPLKKKFHISGPEQFKFVLFKSQLLGKGLSGMPFNSFTKATGTIRVLTQEFWKGLTATRSLPTLGISIP